MFSAKSFLSLLAFSTILFGQINLLSDSITFRTVGSDRVTNHYGMFRVYALGATSSSVLYARNDATTAGDRVAIQGYSVPQANYGIGGKFDGGSKGVVGNATAAGTGNRFGGYFSATGGSGTEYGVYASVSGGSARWSGYFAGGSIYVNGTTYPSDQRFKSGNQPLDEGLSLIMQLKPQKYYYDTTTYKQMGFSAKKQYGLVAQEVEQVIPDIISNVPMPIDASTGTQKPETFKGIDYVSLVPILVAAIQEQQKQINELKAALGGR
jgi:hypothetical protein